MPRTLIFANGVVPDAARVQAMAREADRIICADGGTRHALALGLRPNLIIGDLDSIDEEERKRIEAERIPILAHPHDKNETDLELALHKALEQQDAQIVIVGALGKRLDHTLGNIAVLSDPSLARRDVRLDDGLEELFFCRGERELQGETGDIVSLVAWGAPVTGIRTEGLKWPLQDETLLPDRTRGISNEMLGPSARVRSASGLLLIIHRRQTQAENRTL